MRPVRILLHLCLLVLLVVAAGWLWKNAWAASSLAEPIRLAPGPTPPGKTLRRPDLLSWDGARGALTLRGTKSGPTPCHEIFLAGWPRGMAAHIRFSGEAREIVPGAEAWEDGRMVVIWREEDGEVMQYHHGLLGAKGSGRFQSESVVVLNQPGQASIFLQHAGHGGEFEIDDLEITPVGLRRWVPWATGALLCASGIWWALLFRGIAGNRWVLRACGAAALGLAAVWTLVLPGPWEPLRPLGGPFVLQPSTAAASPVKVVDVAKSDPVAPVPMASNSQPTPPLASTPPAPAQAAPIARNTTTPVAAPALESAELPVPGALESGWFWETYRWVKSKARTLMHLGAFVALTLAFVAILDSKRGWIPVAILGLASEAMQTLFGFGFTWEDAGDLLVNALGIGIGLLLAAGWKKWRAGRVRPSDLTSPPCPEAPPESS